VVKLGTVLLFASGFFILRSSYEMFILTPSYGSQMVFFSLMHTWSSPAVIAFFLSWFAYYAFVLYVLVSLASNFAVHHGVSSRVIHWLAGPRDQSWSRLVYLSASLVLLHLTAMVTYGYWSSALF
jgi:hypothetical protein